MGANSFNVGRDGSQLTIVDSLQGPVTFNGMVSFDAKPRTKKLESETIDGDTRFRSVPNGHEGSFEFDREDSSVTDYFANKEANFFANLPAEDVFITHTVNNTDGTVSQYQYIGVDLTLDDGGTYKGLDKVVQKVSWRASHMIPLAGA